MLQLQQYYDIKPDASFYSVLIKSVGKESILFLAHVLKSGYDCDYYVRNGILGVCVKCGFIEIARKLFDEMSDRTVADWNVMISGYWKCGNEEEASKVFRMMELIFKKLDERAGFRSNYFVKTALLDMHAKCGNLEAAHKIFEQLGYNALIYMYSRCGSMQDAALIFQEMETRDLVSYNTLISGFAEHGQGMESIKLLEKMKKDGIEPDRITYIAVLTACSHAGLLEEGQKVFESIKFPDVDHYACMIDMLGRVGRLEEAMKLIQSMPMEPHAGIYGSLLNATSIHKRVELGEIAAAKLFKVEPHNSGNYMLLANMYALAGRWKDVDKVRDTMRKQGVKKTTGWSWLEHNS
ncbi:hypothetical protein TSUD_381030 [Trifolium subterraneum]|uniref:Pentacotripeptide-repeat region of PRORP domain-containing protein n=2 Tax=Trifolium TaxID=3898 RepID=A0A2Z6NTS2_TRISU|nr:hypothetical protein TSUD_381030 [Trifolium subterraneum]